MGDDFEDDASFLTVLLESSPEFWEELRRAGSLGPSAYMQQVLAFVNAYLTMNDANRLAVFSVGRSGSYLLYRSPTCALPGAAPPAALPGDDYAPQQILRRLQVAMALEAADCGSGAGQQVSTLSAGLSRALCFVNRQQRAAAPERDGLLPQETAVGGGGAPPRGLRPRLLCLTACPDVPSQYIAVMNAIFSAQRGGVAVDGCSLGGGHSTFLQQAAHLTGGVYTRPGRPEALLQYLLAVYLPDAFSRQFLRRPAASSVDLRASCFCHKRIIDVGFVCSVCLSVFCEKLGACTTCGTEFPAAAAAALVGAPGGRKAAPG